MVGGSIAAQAAGAGLHAIHAASGRGRCPLQESVKTPAVRGPAVLLLATYLRGTALTFKACGGVSFDTMAIILRGGRPRCQLGPPTASEFQDLVVRPGSRTQQSNGGFFSDMHGLESNQVARPAPAHSTTKKPGVWGAGLRSGATHKDHLVAGMCLSVGCRSVGLLVGLMMRQGRAGRNYRGTGKRRRGAGPSERGAGFSNFGGRIRL